MTELNPYASPKTDSRQLAAHDAPSKPSRLVLCVVYLHVVVTGFVVLGIIYRMSRMPTNPEYFLGQVIGTSLGYALYYLPLHLFLRLYRRKTSRGRLPAIVGNGLITLLWVVMMLKSTSESSTGVLVFSFVALAVPNILALAILFDFVRTRTATASG